MSEPRIEDRPIEPGPGAAQAAPIARRADRLAVWGVSGAVIGVFLVLDFIMAWFPSPAAWCVAAFVGIVVAQVSLIAVWAALAPGNIVVRVPWSSLFTAALWYALVLGYRAAGSFPLSGAIFLGAVLFFSVAAAEVPLWIAKKVFGWRLIRGAHETVQSPEGPWQFNLQHLLLAMFLVAVALSPLHQVLPHGTINRFPSGGKVFMEVGGILLCHLLISVPCIWCTLSRLRGVVFAPLWLFYCGLLTGVESVALVAAFGDPLGDLFLILLALNAGQGVTVFGTLLIYRALGFRLVRARPPARNTAG